MIPCLELLVLSLATPILGFQLPRNHSHFTQRTYITPSTTSSSYDYIIAGGGLAGLVLASRLTENSSVTVLVLEAGDTGDAVASIINTPAATYYTSLVGSSYDYAYKTVPQSGANNRILNWPRGKVLGGSSAINGMYLVRPNSAEVNAWHDLIAPNGTAAADNWSWDSLLAAMKKSENFTPPIAAVQSVAGMQYQRSSHGTNGPLQASYPAYMVPVTETWLPTMQAAGIPISADADNGNNLGTFFATSAINPTNWTRSYSRSAYLDPASARTNLHVLVNATVTRVTWADNIVAGDLFASGVEYSTGRGAAVNTVMANKEVILSGGAIGSPQILMLSGIGPRDVLGAAGVSVKSELPGVGQHLQDHLAVGVTWETPNDTQGSIYSSGSDFSKTPEFLSFVNSGTAYVQGSFLYGGNTSFATFCEGITGAITNSSLTLVPSQYSQVVDGYKAIYESLANAVLPNSGIVEILLSINSPGAIVIQAALQIPFSQGRVYINSSSVFDQPVIDPQYFSHPADITTMRQALKFVRQIGNTSPLKDILGAEVTPGPTVNTDSDWEAWIRNNAATEFHPTATCAMLPEAQGGVVDANLKVYGTSNVRVVDGSVFPISLSTHLMAPVYGLAEQAAVIIRAATNPSTTSASPSPSSSTHSNTGSTKSSASSTSPTTLGWYLVALFLLTISTFV